jgi:geranylgeranyl pyrophosphate synthase
MMWCHVGQGLDIKYHKAEKKEDLPSLEEYIKLVSMKTGGLMKMLVKMLGVSM